MYHNGRTVGLSTEKWKEAAGSPQQIYLLLKFSVKTRIGWSWSLLRRCLIRNNRREGSQESISSYSKNTSSCCQSYWTASQGNECFDSIFEKSRHSVIQSMETIEKRENRSWKTTRIESVQIELCGKRILLLHKRIEEAHKKCLLSELQKDWQSVHSFILFVFMFMRAPQVKFSKTITYSCLKSMSVTLFVIFPSSTCSFLWEDDSHSPTILLLNRQHYGVSTADNIMSHFLLNLLCKMAKSVKQETSLTLLCNMETITMCKMTFLDKKNMFYEQVMAPNDVFILSVSHLASLRSLSYRKMKKRGAWKSLEGWAAAVWERAPPPWLLSNEELTCFSC